jgi:hypothetical protein
MKLAPNETEHNPSDCEEPQPAERTAGLGKALVKAGNAMNIAKDARERQNTIAANPAAVLVLAGKEGVEDINDIFDKPGVLAFWTIEDDCADDFLRDPMLAAYIANGARWSSPSRRRPTPRRSPAG